MGICAEHAERGWIRRGGGALAAMLLLGTAGCYGTFSGTLSHRGSPGAGVSATMDAMLAAAETGYASHSGGDQPHSHALRVGLAGGYPLLEPKTRFTLVPRGYVGVDHSWSTMAADTSYPLGGELFARWLFTPGDWGVVISPRYLYHAGSDWQPSRDHEVALLIGYTECLSRKDAVLRLC